MTKRFAVLGSPIAHSKSPQIHGAAYQVLGLDWSYTRHEVTAAGFTEFMRQHAADYAGFSVTMPLKQQAAAFADQTHEQVAITGSANTLTRRVDGSWYAANTDVPGLAAALKQTGYPLRHAAVLGAGATAVSAVCALAAAGAQTVQIAARRPEAAAQLVARLQPQLPQLRLSAAGMPASRTGEPTANAGEPAAATVVVSTLPGGADPQLPDHLLEAALFDVAYDPWPTPLATRFMAAGRPVTHGLSMLREQGLLQLRLFVTGSLTEPLPQEVRVHAAISRALALK